MQIYLHDHPVFSQGNTNLIIEYGLTETYYLACLLTNDVLGGNLSVVGQHLLHGSDLVPPTLNVQVRPVVGVVLVPSKKLSFLTWILFWN